MVIIKCKHCNKMFNTFPCRIKIKKFCNRLCFTEWCIKHSKRKWVDKICKNCKKEFRADYSQTKLGYYKFCSNKCKHKYTRGENSHVYKGGWVRPDGYREVCYNGRRWLEHNLVYFLKYGIKSNHKKPIHHKDGNKLNNNISNLILLPIKKHKACHPFTNKAKELMSLRMKKISRLKKRDERGRFVCSHGL